MLKSDWYTLDDAYSILNCSTKQALYRRLMRGKDLGVIKIGKHIKPINPLSQRVKWLVNVKAVDQIGTKV